MLMNDQPVDPAGSEWAPVAILGRTPETADALVHHAHRGTACAACEILRLRQIILELGRQP